MHNISQVASDGVELSPSKQSASINKKTVVLIIIEILLLFPATFVCFAQQSSGGYAESYLRRDVGARAISMGGAYTAISNDPSAIFYNPAGLGFFTSYPVLASSVSMAGLGRTQASLAWGQQVSENLGVGLGINSLFSGTFMGRDVKGNKIGNMSDFQYCIAAGAAMSFEFASLGANIKYLTNNLVGSNTEAQGVAIDVGAKFNVLDLFSFGMSVQNVSGMMFWNTKGGNFEPIPYTIRAGIAMEYGLNETEYQSRSTTDGEVETISEPATRYLLFGIDAVMSKYDLSPTFMLGIEAAAHELIVFRGGIAIYGDKMGKPQLFPMTHWGGGISLRPEINSIFGDLPFKTHLDYSISNEYLSDSKIGHNITILFQF